MQVKRTHSTIANRIFSNTIENSAHCRSLHCLACWFRSTVGQLPACSHTWPKNVVNTREGRVPHMVYDSACFSENENAHYTKNDPCPKGFRSPDFTRSYWRCAGCEVVAPKRESIEMDKWKPSPSRWLDPYTRKELSTLPRRRADLLRKSISIALRNSSSDIKETKTNEEHLRAKQENDR